MASILLINPPTPFLAYPNAAPHIGIGYLISYLRMYKFKADYLNLENDNPESVILPEGYDFYGFTAVSAQYHFAKLLRFQVKMRNLGKTIIGGSHASVMAEECLADEFDYIVKGYGETALLNILRKNVPEGIIQGEFFEELDLLPFPAWDDLLKSTYEMSYGNNVAHIFSMRGCPYTCSYCSAGEIFGTRVGFRSISNVINEIIYLKEKYNIDKLYFLDPTFTINKQRALKLADAIKDLGVTWTCETRVDRIDQEILHSFKKSGCDLISYGIETGSVSVHDYLGKDTTMEQNKLAIKMSHDEGILVKAFLMGALPEDNWKSLDCFKEFISKNKPDTWLFSTFIPFPATEQWKNPDKFKIDICYKDFRAYYNLGLNGRGPLNISNQYLSRDGLKELRDDMLQFLLKEVPNPRVERAIENFGLQKIAFLPFIEDMEQRYMF